MNSSAILPRTPPPTTATASPSLPPRFRLHFAVAAASSSPIPRSPRRRTPPLLSSSSAAAAAAVVGAIRGGGGRNRRRGGGVGSRCVVRCGAREITENEFSDAVLMSDRPVLVEFVADWCGPCRLVAPAVEAVAQEYGDRLTVVKIDHDANPKLIEEFKVYGLPALILFKDGKEVPESRREGAITKAKLKEYIESLLNSPSVV